MGLIPQVKCSRCDRQYSGLRSRCPYCGARRRKKGNKAEDVDNATWKVVIGIILVVVLIAAVVVLLVKSFDGSDEPKEPGNDDPSSIINDPSQGVTTQPGDNPEPDPNPPEEPEPPQEPEPPEEPEDTTPPAVRNVKMTNKNGGSVLYDSKMKRYDFKLKVGDDFTIKLRVTPDDAKDIPLFTSDSPDICAVVPDATDETGRTAVFTALATGNAKGSITVGDVTIKFIVRVVKK